jgi:hypothetical protein
MTCPEYVDISDKYRKLPPLIVEDLRLMESFVDPSTQNLPRSQNHPRNLQKAPGILCGPSY